MPQRRSAFAHKRPAPRTTAPGSPPLMNDLVDWNRAVDPPERYRIVYEGKDGDRTTREIILKKTGTHDGLTYLGVMHLGIFKTLRADRVITVEQLSEGHPSSIAAAPTYATVLPPFPLENAVYKVPTITAGNRTWTVDLNRYTCTCPERRIRSAHGYTPGQLGFACQHMGRAILDHLPAPAPEFTPALRAFLADPRRTHIDNLL